MTRILNYGSLNLDRVYKVKDIVREGETISAQSLDIYPGGKGLNQSVALARAGADVTMAGGIGSDGDLLRETLIAAGVDITPLVVREKPSGHAVIQVDLAGRNCILISAGANHGNTPEAIERVLNGFQSGDLLLLQNEIDGNDEIILQAKKRDMKIALNPSPMDEAVLALPLDQVDYFLVNEHEAFALLERQELTTELTNDYILEILKELGEAYPRATILMTLGSQGSACRTVDGTYLRQPVYPTNVVDTTAAGDTFTGFFLAAHLNDKPLPECLQQASMAASLAVSRPGAAPSIPTLDEVKEALTKI